MRKTWDGRIIGKKYREFGRMTRFWMTFSAANIFFTFLPYVMGWRNIMDLPAISVFIMTMAVGASFWFHYQVDRKYIIRDQSIDDFGNVALHVYYDDGVTSWERPNRTLAERAQRFIPVE